jgi:hypothetical protein
MPVHSAMRRDRPARYEIIVRGELSERFGAAFPEMSLDPAAAQTRISGVILDQAHLHDALEVLRGFVIDLVSVNQVDDYPPPAASTWSPESERSQWCLGRSTRTSKSQQ